MDGGSGDDPQVVPVDVEPTIAFKLVSTGIPGIPRTAHSVPVVVRPLFPPVWTVPSLRIDEPEGRVDGEAVYATLEEGGDADLSSLALLADGFRIDDDDDASSYLEVTTDNRLRLNGPFPLTTPVASVIAFRRVEGGDDRTTSLAVNIHALAGAARVSVLYHDPTSSPPSFYGLDAEGVFRTFDSVDFDDDDDTTVTVLADVPAPLAAIATALDLPYDEPTHVPVSASSSDAATADGAYISVVRPSRLTLAEPTVGAAETYVARRDELLEALLTDDAVAVVRRDALQA